jgi:hypothetical protein
MKYTRFLIVLLLTASLTAFALAQSQTHDHSKIHKSIDTSLVKGTYKNSVKNKYTCPMHSEVISDKPGKCPKCGMTLVKMKSSPFIKKSHKIQKDTSVSHPDMMH